MGFTVGDIIFGAVVFFVMVAVGSSFTLRTFFEVFRHPRELFLGLSLQLLFLPLVAFLLVDQSSLPPALKVGVVVLAACPGGTVSNYVSYLARLRTSLSVGLTVINSLATLITIPLFVNFASRRYFSDASFVSVPVVDAVVGIFLVVLLPVVLGMLWRKFHSSSAVRLERPMRLLSGSLLAVGLIVKFFAAPGEGGAGLTWAAAWQVLPFVLSLHVIGVLAGFFVSRLFLVGPRSSVTLGVEVGLQNTALAILVAGGLLQSEVVGQPALVYALFSFWTVALFVLFARRWFLPRPVS
jgi:bile acid:Na+ symporter, BASS family